MDKHAVGSRLEDLTVIAKTMASRILTGEESDPYAALYWLRRELGYLVAATGRVGVPRTAEVAAYYESQVSDD